jgi:uncharacterized metal-binding protein YceD (DUF177 family)
LPLVPMHEPSQCPAVTPADAKEEAKQKPFENLRALLRER